MACTTRYEDETMGVRLRHEGHSCCESLDVGERK